MIASPGDEPSDGALEEDHGEGPGSAEFAADGGDGGDTGGVEETEEKHGKGGGWGQHVGNTQHAHGADNALLTEEAADEGGDNAPVVKSEGTEDGRHEIGHDCKHATLTAMDHLETEVEGLQEPDDDGGDEDDGEGALDEVARLVPQQMGNAAGGGETIVGEFHDKGGSIIVMSEALEQQHDRHADEDTEQVEAYDHEAAAGGEKGGDEEGVDGYLGRATDEGGEEDGLEAVTGGGEGARGHDSGHRATEADEERHDAAAGEAETAEEFVGDEGYASHVTAVLNEAEEEEEKDNDGHKGKKAAHALEDGVAHERDDGRVDAKAFHATTAEDAEGADGMIEALLHGNAENVDAEPDDEAHDGHEDRQGCPASCQHPVDTAAALVLAAALRMNDGLRTEAADEGVAHVGHSGLTVHAALCLHLKDDVLECLLLVGGEMQPAEDIGIALGEQGGGVAQGNAGRRSMILDEVHDTVKTAVDGSAGIGGVTEVGAHGALLVLGDMDGVLNEFIDALAAGGGDGHHGDAEDALHLVDADGAAGGDKLVHHVDG